MAVDYEESFKSVVVHEFGHVLGYDHEQQRPDSMAGCPEADPGPLPDGGFENHNNVTINGVPLTVYDADSIMNYCRGTALPDGGFASPPLPYQLGYKEAEKLSRLDELGIEMLYPSGSARKITSIGSANYKTNYGLVVRKESGVVPEWSARGAIDSSFLNMSWSVDGLTSGSSITISPATWGDGAHSVALTFSDHFGRAHQSGETVFVSNGLHTALALSALW